MPLDSSNFSQIELNRQRLLDALDAGPEGWDYCENGKCACHTAATLFAPEEEFLNVRKLAVILGVPLAAAQNVFLHLNHTTKTLMWNITPKMVADALRAEFAKHPVEVR